MVTQNQAVKGARAKALTEWQKKAESFARCRAYVLQAIHALDGPTYIEIRQWIRENKRFEMENVGARVRELAREIKPPMAIIKYDGSGKVHVFPIEVPVVE
jgi:hypothetical protein